MASRQPAVGCDQMLSKLKEVGWNVSRAAKVLGLERSYLYRKMKTYGIEKE